MVCINEENILEDVEYGHGDEAEDWMVEDVWIGSLCLYIGGSDRLGSWNMHGKSLGGALHFTCTYYVDITTIDK